MRLGARPVVSVFEESVNSGVFDRARIVIGMLDDEPRGAIQLIEGHSDLLQRSRSADADREVKNALCSVLTAGQA